MSEAAESWRANRVNAQLMLLQLRTLGLRTKTGRRKLRLFACACCRLIWDHLPGDHLRDAVMVAERYADRQATKSELASAYESVAWLMDDRYHAHGAPLAGRVALDMAVAAAHAQPFKAAFSMTATLLPLAGHWGSNAEAEAVLCDLVRCVFGNPFQQVAIPSSWLSWNEGTIGKLAQGIYEERAFDRLPILGDALEEAGCTEEAILGHCRGCGKHGRGCWVVDNLRG